MAQCECIYVNSEGSGPDFYSSTDQKARKQHTCCECERIIFPGEKYRVETGSWGGKFKIYKTCNDCMSVRNEYFCDGYFYKELWEDYHNHIVDVNGEINTCCLNNLTVTARNKIIKMIDEYFEKTEE